MHDDAGARHEGRTPWVRTWFAARRRSGVLLVAIAALVAAALAAAATADAGVPLTKREARRVAVAASADACRVVDWCRGSHVVPPEHCRRQNRRTVFCPISFVTPEGDRCVGGVLVKKTTRGRLDKAVAVPFDCRAGAEGVTQQVR